MSEATAEHAREARRQQRDFERIENASAAAMTAMAAAESGLLTVYTGVVLAIGFYSRDRAILMAAIAADPPDPDFTVRARVRRGQVIRFQSVVADPVTEAADAVLDALTLGTATLRAMLRAAERSAGAQEAKQWNTASERHAEAVHHGRRAAAENQRYADSVRLLHDRLETRLESAGVLRSERSTTRERRRTRPRGEALARERSYAIEEETETVTPRDALSSSALALLYQAGAPMSLLDRSFEVWPARDPVELFMERLRLSSRAARRYSGYLTRTVNRELTT